MTVQTQVGEADVAKLRQGMSSYFTTLGSPGRRFYGQLRKIEPTPTVTNNVVLYNALFDVPNPNKVLMPQMTAQVFFVVAEARDVLVVPVSALTYQRAPRAQPATAAALDDVQRLDADIRDERCAEDRRTSPQTDHAATARAACAETPRPVQHRQHHAARSSKSRRRPTNAIRRSSSAKSRSASRAASTQRFSPA